MITVEDFEKIDMRVGTILEASVNEKARKSAYKLKIDLGEMGIKNSSAQITDFYKPEDLIGMQVVVVTNFPLLKVADVKSEVRILGAVTNEGCVLLNTERKVINSSRIL